ncbi:MAG: TfoX/Sxy family protein [Gammaproteobacteria bacterium]
MAVSQQDSEFVAYVVDLLQSVGPVSSRRMFGGHGIFLEGLMFGLIAGQELYLKVDGQSREEFTALGLQPFTYLRQGKTMQLNYYQAPEEALELPATMAEWGNKAYATAVRAAAAKRQKAHAQGKPEPKA